MPNPSTQTNPPEDETPEEQVFRVMKEMVINGEMEMTVGEDGELYFSLPE